MHAITIIVASLGLLTSIASACCDVQDLTGGCCGKGGCNIFCCNCDGGCKPNSECHFSALCGLECAPFLEDPPAYAACLAVCSKASKSKRGEEGEGTSMFQPGAVLFNAMDDKEIYDRVAKDADGGFTFDEYAAYLNSSSSVGLKIRFERFDKNGDGVITLDEMRV